jgi:hypothetical protein
MHEDFRRTVEHKGPSDRSFGITIGLVLTVIGLAPLRHRGPVRIWTLVPAAIILTIALVQSRLLHRFNTLWMQLGALLNRVVNPVLMAILFYVVVTPIGLLVRLLSRGLLPIEFDARRLSYWIDRIPPGPPPETMTQQF